MGTEGRALEATGATGTFSRDIENVGNLVCPALFDLGEHANVAILSMTEEEDKQLKYPYMFRAAQVMLLNKIDLLPHLTFDVEPQSEFERSYRQHVGRGDPLIWSKTERGAGSTGGGGS